MNAAVRATVRVGLYAGAKVYFVHEVGAAYMDGWITEQAYRAQPQGLRLQNDHKET